MRSGYDLVSQYSEKGTTVISALDLTGSAWICLSDLKHLSWVLPQLIYMINL